MLIEYKKVRIFQEDVCVLNDVDFHVEEGEFIYIIGKADAALAASVFHFGEIPIPELKEYLRNEGINVRL